MIHVNKTPGCESPDNKLVIHKKTPTDKVVALAGNPNVGKSTVFNGLTGMKQHTGNWPGKTVCNTQGFCKTRNGSYVLVDLPGTYSLMAHSLEEEVARNFICFEKPDAVVVVCDATCLERNLNLVLQTIEITKKVIVCVNLMDEARSKKIKINLKTLSESLGVPVIGTTARKKKSLKALTAALDELFINPSNTPIKICYPDAIEKAINIIQPVISKYAKSLADDRWLALRLLDNDEGLINELVNYMDENILEEEEVANALVDVQMMLYSLGLNTNMLKDMIVSTLINTAHSISQKAVTYENENYNSIDRKIDKILTSKCFGYPIMIFLLAMIFWLTIAGANYPSALIADGLFWIQDRLSQFFLYIHAPSWLHGILILGVYRVVAWVVSVMLPPMAIFFPLFTLLEDLGYLPRIAYNLDKPFKYCRACGKQALTMSMGFGCNAVGIVGCRIIDSPRERLLAILTNNFVPCNGRFPTLIAILSMFFVTTASGVLGTFSSLYSAVLLTLVIVFGIVMTFVVTKILSHTLLKGLPSSFTLELPSYRKPQIGNIILRSIFDRTLFVLGRAIVVAAPAGLLIWLMANIFIGNTSILCHCATFLDPFARLMGLDGVILIAFILGFPANEIVVPIIIMAYMAQGSILELDSLMEMKRLFVANGWTFVTAICTMLFSLMHWPCSTTLLTIKKETKSIKWTVLSALIPTVIGILVCMAVRLISLIIC